MQECRQGSNNTFELLLKNIKDVGLEFSTPTPGNGDCFFLSCQWSIEEVAFAIPKSYPTTTQCGEIL